MFQNDTAAGRPASPIEGSLGQVRIETENAHGLISSLSDRLTSVLAPELAAPPTPGEVAKEAPQSPLHAALLDARREVEALNRRLSGLLGRLTV